MTWFEVAAQALIWFQPPNQPMRQILWFEEQTLQNHDPGVAAPVGSWKPLTGVFAPLLPNRVIPTSIELQDNDTAGAIAPNCRAMKTPSAMTVWRIVKPFKFFVTTPNSQIAGHCRASNDIEYGKCAVPQHLVIDEDAAAWWPRCVRPPCQRRAQQILEQRHGAVTGHIVR